MSSGNVYTRGSGSGSYVGGSSWDENESVVMEFDTDWNGDALWSLRTGDSVYDCPTLELNVKPLAKLAKLNEKETEWLLKACDAIGSIDADFASFSSEGEDGGYDWDGPIGGWYEVEFSIDSIPTDDDLFLGETFKEYCEGELPDEEIQEVMKKLKEVDYEGNIKELEFREKDSF